MCVCVLFAVFVCLFFLPVIEWSSRDEGGVCAGVWWWWWCVDVSPSADAVKPPYKALKSSGVLLHFRLWCVPPPPPPPPPIDVEFLLLLSKMLIVAADRRSCDDNPKRRWFSCVVMPIKQRLLSCKVDISFEWSWCEAELPPPPPPLPLPL